MRANIRPKRLVYAELADTVDHLGELRTRVCIALVAVASAFAVIFAFHGRLIHLLNAPLAATHLHPVTFGVAEPFMTSIKVSLYAALAVSLPIVLGQLWGFVAPAVRPEFQRSIRVFVAFAMVLFCAGVVFGYVIALPAAVHFLLSYDNSLYNIQVRAQDYYSFAALAITATGLVFELPIAMLALVRVRILSGTKLRKNRRIGYAAVAVIAVALPGVDPVTTMIEMVPLALLYESTIWIAVACERRWNRELAETLADSAATS